MDLWVRFVGSSKHIEISGVAIDINVENRDSTNTLRTAIDDVSAQTGVRATINESGHLVLTANDGRNIALNIVEMLPRFR